MSLSTLEVLYAARDKLESGGKFDFGDWQYCTCGHIYRGAHGSYARTYGDCLYMNPPFDAEYYKAITEVAYALGWDPERNPRHEPNPTGYVSDYTADLAGNPDDEVTREHALMVINEAINNIEAKEREAMMGIAKKMIDEVGAAIEVDPDEARAQMREWEANATPEEIERQRDGMVCT